MSNFFVILVSTFVNIMSILLLIYVVISWFVPPYNEFRMKLDQLMNQFLDPIRRIMPTSGMFDFSPIILMLLLQFFESIVKIIF